MQQRDSVGYAVGVATVLCVVCSLAVSAAAVALRPLQEANKKLDQQKNILDATGLAIGEYGKPANELTREQIDDLYSWISEELVDLETGEYNTELDIEKYDPREAAEKEATSVADRGSELMIRAKIAARRSPRSIFVRRRGEGPIQQVVLPVYGKGLWSTLYGYLALKSDLETIQGLTFYQHGETPGLGGEVDNPRLESSVGRATTLRRERRTSRQGRSRVPAPPDDNPTPSMVCPVRRSPVAGSPTWFATGPARTVTARFWISCQTELRESTGHQRSGRRINMAQQ